MRSEPGTDDGLGFVERQTVLHIVKNRRWAQDLFDRHPEIPYEGK